VPSGTYIISSTLTLRSTQQLVGAGRDRRDDSEKEDSEQCDGVIFHSPELKSSGFCSVKFIHSYGNSGAGVRIKARIQAAWIFAGASGKEGIVIEKEVEGASFGKLFSSESYGRDGAYNTRISGTANQVGQMVVNELGPDPNTGKLRKSGGDLLVNGPHNMINSAYINGAQSSSPVGVFLDASGTMFRGTIVSYKDEGAVGLKTNQVARVMQNIQAKILNCNTAWYHGSTGESSTGEKNRFSVQVYNDDGSFILFDGAGFHVTDEVEFWGSRPGAILLSKQRGIKTIPAGEIFVDVEHKLKRKPNPTDISVLPRSNLDGLSYWVSNIGDTTFRINISGRIGGAGATFTWRAEL
jgi:hypothetical protein